MPHPLLRFRLATLLLVLVVAYGMAGYMVIEGWNALDAFYMTITTIATVGYGEVHPLSAWGRVFTATLIVGGVGTMLYAFGVFAEVLSEGYITEYGRRRRLERTVAGMRDHFIVCGYGRIGTQIADEFERSKVAYLAIDNNPEAVARLQAQGRPHIEGDASDEEILKAAGIDRARCLISAVDSDERAVYITLATRALNRELYVIARAGRPASIRRLELAGANRVVSPYRMAGHQMAELALRPGLVEVMDLIQHGDSEVGVEELIVEPGSSLIGRTVREAGFLESGLASLVAVRRRDGKLHVSPPPDLGFEEGDLIFALGSAAQLSGTAALMR
jgi:voltage-gated potassium channel